MGHPLWTPTFVWPGSSLDGIVSPVVTAPTNAREPAPQLERSEADYRQLANALHQVIWTCDAQGRLEWVNDWWMALTGLSGEESLHDKGGPDRRASG